jgi:glyceraldehyde-3-phosphate dehydrogenase (ferredoxin)
MPKALLTRALLVHADDGAPELRTFDIEQVLGPIDFGLRMLAEGDWFCVGSGVLAGGIIPGSNRLIFSGRSPVWEGFYVSAMGGAGLLFDGLGISYLGISGRAPEPSLLVVSCEHGGDPFARLVPVRLAEVWSESDGPGGVYGLQRHALEHVWEGSRTPRVLATGPAALSTSMGAICSSRISKGKLTAVDCWAGRGGMGSLLLQSHNIAGIVYGGDFEDDDLSDRAEADGYFKEMFSKKMVIEDLEATTKYRYDPKWKSGGTFGVNYSKLADWMLSYNYNSVNWSGKKRQDLWESRVRDHYLDQFNRETIETKSFAHCGEPCPAVCKKLHGDFKKDYEPYQTMGPLIGIFDQRAAEQVNHKADMLGFDAIQIGGQLAWLMECLKDGIIEADELRLPPSAPRRPAFEPDGADFVGDSHHNASLALALLERSLDAGSPLARGMRKAAREFGPRARDRAVYLSNGENGWMVPNQYWVPGMLAPIAIMGKYYTYYHADFMPPGELGRACAERMIAEITIDNAGMCRFHRGWAEKLWPQIVCGHFDIEIDFPAQHARLAQAIHGQGRPVYWESARIEEMLHGYLRQIHEEQTDRKELGQWLARFESDRSAAAHAFFDELKAGIEERIAEACK